MQEKAWQYLKVTEGYYENGAFLNDTYPERRRDRLGRTLLWGKTNTPAHQTGYKGITANAGCPSGEKRRSILKTALYEDGLRKSSVSSSKTGLYEDGWLKIRVSSQKIGLYEDGLRKSQVGPQKQA